MRFLTVLAADMHGEFDPNVAPLALRKYSTFFPMVLFIPGPLWDAAMRTPADRMTAPLSEGVKVFNGTIVNGVPEYSNIYDFRNPNKFVEWVDKCVEEQATPNKLPALPSNALLRRRENTRCGTLRLISRPR